MEKNYENIFYHQGQKIYDSEKIGDNIEKITHLENDVTKSFLCLLIHSDNTNGLIQKLLERSIPAPIPADLALLNRPEFIFQVGKKTSGFANKKARYLLVIKSILTEHGSASSGILEDKHSIPDGAIYSDDIVFLIEAKTQSSLDEKQLQYHTKNYLGGSATRLELNWEDIYFDFEKLVNGNTVSQKDKFLTKQFCEYLDILGLGSYKFNEEDFISKQFDDNAFPQDEREQQLRRTNAKFKKLIRYLEMEMQQGGWVWEEIKSSGLRGWNKPGFDLWYSFYKKGFSVLNINLTEEGLIIIISSEVMESTEKFRRNLNERKEEFDSIVKNIYPKVHLRVWRRYSIGGQGKHEWTEEKRLSLPKNDITAEAVLRVITNLEDVSKYKEEKEKCLKDKGVCEKLSAKEKDYLLNKNRNPKYALRFIHSLSVNEITTMSPENMKNYLLDVVNNFKPLFDFANSSDREVPRGVY